MSKEKGIIYLTKSSVTFTKLAFYNIAICYFIQQMKVALVVWTLTRCMFSIANKSPKKQP